jgi:hypothetical protein
VEVETVGRTGEEEEGLAGKGECVGVAMFLIAT